MFFFSRQTGFSSESIRLMLKPLVPTEPAIQSTRLLGLGLKLYPSNRLRMLNKDLTRFMQSLSRVRQFRASEKEVLLEGYDVSSNYKCCK